MAELLQKGLVTNLEDAYEKAKLLNPHVINNPQQGNGNNMQYIENAQQAAQNAKRKNVSLKSTSPSKKTAKSNDITGDYDKDMDMEWDRAFGNKESQIL